LSEFLIDARLKSDCLPVCDLQLSQLLLMNDARWPWLILAPRIRHATEIHLLDNSQQQLLQNETAMAARILSKITDCEKINTGALGNIVRQLHVHIIGRNEGDENWPGPVWGFGERRPYAPDAGQRLVDAIKERVKAYAKDTPEGN
jgi:diadenosine tetraphosphate (Ap4A) HIT family hydrolase